MSNHADWTPTNEAMGLMAGYRWNTDPRTLLFVLSRYKFVAKMLAGKAQVLEVGCADAFGSRIVRQAVGALTALDIDRQMIQDAEARQNPKWDVLYILGDMATIGGQRFDALYALDVLEHVLPSEEGIFMAQARELAPICIVGMPSLESQPYGHQFSKANHVNCKTEDGLRSLMQRFYSQVFIFGMNDEVVHTGFGPMCQYRFALCVR